MTDVRELLARLSPATIRMEIGTGGGVGALTNIDIAAALGMVPAGLGRDLLELLHGPDPSRAQVVRVFQGITRLALEERNRRSKMHIDARMTLSIAECMAKFQRGGDERGMRNLEILRARVAVAHGQLMPERLDERMPQIASVVVGYMKGNRLSNRDRASVLGVSESAYRQSWASVVDWILTQMIDAEALASRKLALILSDGTEGG